MFDKEDHVGLLNQLAEALHYQTKKCVEMTEDGWKVQIDETGRANISLYCEVLTARASESRRQHEELTR